MNPPSRPTRVLWLAKGLGQGGMERLLVTQGRFGDRQRFDYRAAHLVDRPHTVIAELEELRVPVTRLGTGLVRDPRWVADLVGLVRREQIDVVHAHSPLPAAVARPMLRLLARRTRIVYTEHNRWDRFSLPTRLANAATYPLNDRCFAVSDDCRESIPALLRGSVVTLEHGIDVADVRSHRAERSTIRLELGLNPDAFVVGTVANLRAQKNYPLLLEVAAEVVARDPTVVFLSVGQGPLESELLALHQRLDLQDRFRFLGFRSDAHAVMSAFDLFCLSSDHEGLPVALMEAKALGLPVAATSVGGIPAAVADGVDGLVVPPQDKRALVEAILSLRDDDRRRSDLARASLRSAERFDATVAVAQIESSYLPSTGG